MHEHDVALYVRYSLFGRHSPLPQKRMVTRMKRTMGAERMRRERREGLKDLKSNVQRRIYYKHNIYLEDTCVWSSKEPSSR